MVNTAWHQNAKGKYAVQLDYYGLKSPPKPKVINVNNPVVSFLKLLVAPR